MMLYRLRLTLVCASFALISCSTTAEDHAFYPSAPSPQPEEKIDAIETQQSQALRWKPRPQEAGLREEVARVRSQRVKNVVYELEIQLDKRSTRYEGKLHLSFTLFQKNHPLTLDFHEGEIRSGSVNEKPGAFEYNGYFLTFPPESLVEGRNHIELEFSQNTSRNGSGLYRFQDPEDDRVYLYSDFEPYDANRMFPCFDQPDLKGRFRLKVDAPSSWTVISATNEKRVESLPNKKKRWTFPSTRPISTYLFSLHAGPYHSWESRSGKIPLRLFARRSISKYVDQRGWFQVTKQGLTYFQKTFQYPYPFKKYDQIIVPDFNAGAMENVGAVTFSERYVQRSISTLAEKERRAIVILHEMAHMWFGNLVTMKWWNDLWLNESFATYMATLAAVEATSFQNAWQGFFTGMKKWAYDEDQYVTTHPIEGAVPDTRQAFANFDGITYGKGAASLKQVSFLIGQARFKEGVQQYFKKYAFKNTTLQDFLSELEAASQTNLAQWTHDWIQKSGVNSIRLNWKCQNGKLSSLTILQTASSSHPHLRAHQTQVGLLYLDSKGKLVARKKITLAYQGPKTEVTDLLGAKCPVAVYPNLGDHDFAKVQLDPQSLRTFQKSLSKTTDPLLRAMVWHDLWNMVRDAQLSALDYSELVLNHLGAETDLRTLDFVGKTLHGSNRKMASVIQYLPYQGKKMKPFRTNFLSKLETFVWNQLIKAKGRSDQQKFWFDTYTQTASSSDGLDKLHRLLTGKQWIPGLRIDQDRRWSLLYALSQHSYPETAALIEKESLRDPSEEGKKQALAAKVAKPYASTKKSWFKQVTGGRSSMSLARARAIMSNLFPVRQDDLKKAIQEEFYGSLPQLAASRNEEYLGEVSWFLAPTVCNLASRQRMESFISQNAQLPPLVLKNLKKQNQEVARCISARNFALEKVQSRADPNLM